MGQYALTDLYLDIHPTDADARGIEDGDHICVFNPQGEVECLARVRDRVRPGVVVMPKGAWRASSRNGRTATALCPAHVQVETGGACFNDARVDVRRVGVDGR
jgi:anaerobic selenocysteine-containing dehydrogenase